MTAELLNFTPTRMRWYSAVSGAKVMCHKGKVEKLGYGSTSFLEFRAKDRLPHPQYGQFQWGFACSITSRMIIFDGDYPDKWAQTAVGRLLGPWQDVATSVRDCGDGTFKFHVVVIVPLELVHLWPKRLPALFGHIISNGLCYADGVHFTGTEYKNTGKPWIVATEELMRAMLEDNGGRLHTDHGSASDDSIDDDAEGWEDPDGPYSSSIANNVLGSWIEGERNESLITRCGIIKGAGDSGYGGMKTLFDDLCAEYDGETGRGDSDVYRAYARSYPAWGKAHSATADAGIPPDWLPALGERAAKIAANEQAAAETLYVLNPDGTPTGQAYLPPAPLPWDEPVPLADRSSLPAFPVHVYPAWLADMVLAVAANMQVPADLPGMVALSVLATALGGRARVAVRLDWVEPLNLYAVVAMPPGSRKSPVHAAFTAPVLKAEYLLAEQATSKIAEAKATKAVALKAAQAAQSAAVKDPDKTSDAIAAAVLADAIEIPVVPRIVADDVTPEACASLMAEQNGRIAILSAEGGPFVTLAGRYSGQPNLEIFLKAWSGDMVRVDRKGRAPEYIANPALTLGLTVQPEVLRQIAVMPGFHGRGLLARVLFAVPASNVGRRATRTVPIPVNVKVAYAAQAGVLVKRYAEWEDPAAMMLSDDAREMLLDAAEALEPRLGPDGDLAHLADWASKLIGTTARIAALLHAAGHDEAWKIPVSAGDMAKALQLAAYLEAHAVAAAGYMGSDPALADAEAVLDWIRRTGLAQFAGGTRTALTGPGSARPTMLPRRCGCWPATAGSGKRTR